MNRIKKQSDLLVNETLLGGESMHISDLSRYESMETRWLIISSDKRDLDIRSVNS